MVSRLAFVALSCVWLCCVSLSCDLLRAQDAVPIKHLPHESAYRLAVDPGLSAVRISTVPDGLLLLVRDRSVLNLVKTDVAGKPLRTIPLASSEKSNPDHICTDTGGGFAIVFQGGRAGTYNADGTVVKSYDFSGLALGCGFSNGGLYIVTPTLFVGLDSNESIALATPLRSPALVLALSGQRVGVLETVEGRLRIVDPRARTETSVQLEALEVRGIGIRSTDASVSVPAIAMAASDPSAKLLYALANPLDQRAGAKILVFDESGVLVSRIISPVPMFEMLRTAQNPSGRFQLTDLAYLNQKLLLVSRNQSQVLQLPLW